jgi:hypothetical protein
MYPQKHACVDRARGELSQLVEHSFQCLRALVRDEARRIAAKIAKLPGAADADGQV